MKRLLLLVLFLFLQTAHADDLKSEAMDYSMGQVTMGNTFSSLSASSQLQKNYSDERVQYSYVISKVEAFNGCNIAQSVAGFPFGTHWLFPNEYKCIGTDNIINSGIKAGYLAEYGNLYATLTVFGFFIVSLGSLFFIYYGMTHKNPEPAGDTHEHYEKMLEEELKKAKYGMVMILATLVGILIFVCRPAYENDDGVKSVSLAGIATMAIIGSAEESFNQYDQTITSFGTMSYPLLTIPKNQNQKVDSWLSVIQYMICNSENTTYASQDPANKINFNYDGNGNYAAFAQKGSCTLNVSFKIDPKSLIVNENLGVNFQSVVESAAKKYIQEGFTTASEVANKIVTRNGRQYKDSPVQFDASRFTCSDMTTYSVDRFSPDSVSNYAAASADCIGQNFAMGMNKYPKLSEDFYTKKVKNRAVHLCEQDSYTQNADDAKYDDTPQLLNAGDDSSALEGRLKSCVTKMCGDDSSPYVCSAAIHYYDEMSGNRAVTESNILTKTQNFIATQFTSKTFADAGKVVFNSFGATYTDIPQSVLAEDEFGDVAFTITFDSVNAGAAVGNARTSIDVKPVINLSTGQAWQALTDLVTRGDDGMFGSLAFSDCLAYPEQLSPSGRNCGSVYDTVKDFGNILYADGTMLIVSVKTSSILNRSSAERAAETAVIGATKRSLMGSNMMGTAAIVGALTAAGILETSGTDAYAENNSSMTVVVATVIGIIYAVPSMENLMSMLGHGLQALGIFLVFVFPLVVAGMMIVFAISIVVFWIEINMTTFLYFLLLLSKNNGVNETTDYFRVVDELIEFYWTVVIFPIRFIFAILFIKACFLFGVIDLDSMLSMPNSITAANTFQNVGIIVGNFAVKALLFVAFIWVMMLEPARTRRYVHAMIFGKINKGTYDEQDFEETDEYRLDIKRAYSL